MKTLILTSITCACAVTVFGQGTVFFGNRTAAGITHVYAPNPLNFGQSLVGLGSNDTPVSGTTPFAANGMVLIGGQAVNPINGQFGAATTFAQLLGAVGSNQPESSLTPQGLVTTFRTGGAAGNTPTLTDTLQSIPKDAPFATLEMVAWDNSSGLYSTWTQASVAWLNGLIVAGKSGTFNLASIGGDSNTPPNTFIPNSFNLYSTPEPSAFALAGLGAVAALIFRRRK